MKTNFIRTWGLATLMMFACTPTVLAGTVEILGMTIDNLGMNKRMIRMGDDGFVLDNAGLNLESTVKLRITGFVGQRLLCAVAPLNAQGEELEDRMGVCANLTGINVSSDQQTVSLKVPLPYGWMDLQQERLNLSFKVLIFNSDIQRVAGKVVNVPTTSINIDRENLPAKMMGDLLGGGDGGGLDMGGLLGGLLGGPSISSEEICGACDGTGLCSECYGDAFFDPSMCRRCSRAPGICRRCKGEKTETVNYDVYGY